MSERLSIGEKEIMRKYIQPSRGEWGAILARPVFDPSSLEGTVLPILDEVKEKGDEALKSFTAKFDGTELEDLLVTPQEIEEALPLVSDELKKAIAIAESNVRTFHEAQREPVKKIETTPGVLCWRESRAISKVGLYIPGGTAPLFSTILMLAVPAQVAGCKEIVLCTPPNKEGKIHPAMLYTAHLLGLDKIVKVGGAQAVAGMAYGTESVPQVFKIFGPGNQYVTAAKQLVARENVAIDMPAGPSEVLVIADRSADAGFVASDLLSQAEHGVDSQVVVVSTSEEKIGEIEEAIATQLEKLPRKDIAQKALENSRSVVLADMSAVVDFTNAYAPEHLIIQTENFEEYVGRIENAGSVFLGHYTPESAGDYASGTNHTLPTNGFANAYSGVSLDSFIKKITFQEISKVGIENLGPHIELMAAAEELEAHKNAVTLRLASLASD